MNTLRISLIALGMALGLYACSTEEFEGPSIVVLLGEFDILDSLRVTDSTPDFPSMMWLGSMLNSTRRWTGPLSSKARRRAAAR